MNQKAFTLIELLVVVLIIGILAAIALPQYQKAVEKARIASAIPVLNSVAEGMELYLLENGYPSSGEKFFLWPDDPDIGVSAEKVEADVNVKGNLDCVGHGGFCADSSFLYEAECNVLGCFVSAYRNMDAYNGEGSYSLSVDRYLDINHWEYRCYYFDAAGQRACSTLQGIGSWQIIDGNE